MRYRKPRSFNLVTVLLLLGTGLVVYVLVYLWPVYSSSSRVKGLLYDQIPALYKANLRPDDVARSMIESIKENIAAEMRKNGINDKGARIFVYRNPKEISLEVRFKTKAHFPYPDRTFEFEMSPRVVSDATRVDW
jgi:hypothetical protein